MAMRSLNVMGNALSMGNARLLKRWKPGKL